MKKRTFLLLVTALSFFVFSNNPIRALAKTDNSVAEHAFGIERGWSEEIQQGTWGQPKLFQLASTNVFDTWVLRSTKDCNFGNNCTITLNSYTMELLNDTKLCKGVTVHSKSFYGYVSAHFANIWGAMDPDSYSGRTYSYYGGVAETPDAPGGNGWLGIAHTNCGI